MLRHAGPVPAESATPERQIKIILRRGDCLCRDCCSKSAIRAAALAWATSYNRKRYKQAKSDEESAA